MTDGRGDEFSHRRGREFRSQAGTRLTPRGGWGTKMEEAAATQTGFDRFDPAFLSDPYPFYKMLYGQAPMVLQLELPTALLARYADVVAALRDPQTFSSAPIRQISQAHIFGGAPTLILTDPPVHTRLRRLVNQAFAPRRIREMEPRIRQIANDLMTKVERAGSFEAMKDLAEPLPTMVIAEMLGVPSEDYIMFKEWSDALLEVSNVPPGAPPPPSFDEALAAERAYFKDRYEELRRKPGSDLMSMLIQAQEKDALSFDEVAGFFNLLLLAGNETTTNLIGNGLYALMRYPDQYESLRRDTSLMPGAIEEMLRFDCPVQATGRNVIRECEFGGVRMQPGTMVVVLNGAANRDPAQFPDPERFDIRRDPNDHVAFGEGIHFCLGAALARLEGSIGIAAVLERFPRLRLAAEPAYKKSFNVRGLVSLPLNLE
jgi:cytochrome P450